MNEFRVVLTHSGSNESEAILEKLADTDLAADSLVLLGDEANAGRRLAYSGSYIEVLEQESFDFDDCALVLMPGSDNSIEQRLVHHDALLVSHCIDGEEPPVFAASADSELKLSYSQTRIRLCNPEMSCLLGVLPQLRQVAEIRRINLVFLQTAESRGKAAIDELAEQTISLLNAREATCSIYPLQIAFNMIPARNLDRFDLELPLLLGNCDIICIHQVIDVAAFHGFVASVQLEFAEDINIEAIRGILSENTSVLLSDNPGSPISDCNQSFSCVINHLERAQNQSNNVHFWMIADPMRYGLANNYVNVTEFLLKSFL